MQLDIYPPRNPPLTEALSVKMIAEHKRPEKSPFFPTRGTGNNGSL